MLDESSTHSFTYFKQHCLNSRKFFFNSPFYFEQLMILFDQLMVNQGNKFQIFHETIKKCFI